MLVDGVDLGTGVRAGFTSRTGGHSSAPFDTLNLGLGVGDDPTTVARNRAVLDDWVGARVAYATQVHGIRVVTLSEHAGVGEADAIVSTSPDVAVAVLVADCVPVLLADASAGVVAAAHAGRRGLASGVLQATVAAMVAAGADVDRLRTATGPAIAGRSYEVPAELRDEIADVLPVTAATTSWGTPALDLPAGVEAVLRGLGVRHVQVSERDTYTDGDLFSYRRASRTGRFAGVVRPPR